MRTLVKPSRTTHMLPLRPIQEAMFSLLKALLHEGTKSATLTLRQQGATHLWVLLAKENPQVVMMVPGAKVAVNLRSAHDLDKVLSFPEADSQAGRYLTMLANKIVLFDGAHRIRDKLTDVQKVFLTHLEQRARFVLYS